MNVLVIPEDFRKDQHLLRPLIQALLAHLGKPRAKVVVCFDPLLAGVSRALDEAELNTIVRDNPMVDLFLLCVDRDGEPGRRAALDRLEARLQPRVKKESALFLGENAWQELEVWTLAGHDLPSDWQWAVIRTERDPKERYFEPLARARGVHETEGGGRRTLGEKAARRFRRVCQRCPEVQTLCDRVRAWLAAVP